MLKIRTARKRRGHCHMAGMSREERRAEIGERGSEYGKQQQQVNVDLVNGVKLEA